MKHVVDGVERQLPVVDYEFLPDREHYEITNVFLIPCNALPPVTTFRTGLDLSINHARNVHLLELQYDELSMMTWCSCGVCIGDLCVGVCDF